MGGGFLRFYAIYVTFSRLPPSLSGHQQEGNFELGWKRKRGYVSNFVWPAPIKRRKMSFEPFTTYDGTSINNEQELQDWMEKNNKRNVTESVEELEKKEKITKERQEKEEFEQAKKTIRRLNNSTLNLSRRKRDRSVKSNINLRGIRNKDKKIKQLTTFESTRTFQ